ncbi:MAG: type II secretion system F family protein [Clostridiales bacterium]|nr:type II secretion system F family protein [Clostridiales bacterium]
MPNFRYQVIDSAGKKSEGVLDAGSIAEATRKLKGDGKFVLSVELDKGPGLLNMEIGSKKLNTKELVLISRQLSALLSAGITIIRSLDMLYQQVDSKRAKKVVGDIYESIQSGRTLSDAFKDQKDALPAIMISMVSAGEESGRLDEVMGRLAEHFQKQSKLKNKISSAMVYPKILFFLTIAITVGLLTFLVPGIAQTIKDLGGDLPTLTKVVMAISDSLVKFWYVYAIVVAGLVFGFKTWKKSEKGHYAWDNLMIKMPVVGKATKMNAAAMFCRTISTLLKSGISVLTAVEITAASLDNVVLEKKLADARVEIRKGTQLSKSIKNITEFPPMIYAMVAIGEESGTLDTILDKAADFFEDEADAATTKMTAALEPIMLILMAILVGTTVGAIAMPIFTMAQFVG